jgi:brefeldin A-resistance guanine nucleotide exchange factor 1
MAGIAKILEKDSSVVRSQTEWGLIIALFRATANHPEASKVTLAIVQKMVNEQSGPEITADNWKGVVDLLDEFATAAGWANATSGVRRPGMQQQLHQRQGSQKQALQLAPVVERGMAALESLYELQHFVPRLSKEIPPNDSEQTLS